MWTFVEVVRIGQDFGQWHALVTLAQDGSGESFYLTFADGEPTQAQAAAAGARLALQKNLAAALPVSDSMPREDFFGRFTNAEIARIYKAAQANDDLFAYVKKLEMNPSVNRRNQDVIDGLNLLEYVGLLDHPGRAAEILGS